MFGYCFSQQSPNVQKFSNFQISCPCKLNENRVFKSMAVGKVDVAESLTCALKSGSNSTIYNINVYNEGGGAKKFITNYAISLNNSGISYNTIVLDGIPVLEYTFTQNGIPAKAIVFYRYDQSYLFQVTSRVDLEGKFSRFKNSFRKLN